jgi:hypothetical protein
LHNCSWYLLCAGSRESGDDPGAAKYREDSTGHKDSEAVEAACVCNNAPNSGAGSGIRHAQTRK